MTGVQIPVGALQRASRCDASETHTTGILKQGAASLRLRFKSPSEHFANEVSKCDRDSSNEQIFDLRVSSNPRRSILQTKYICTTVTVLRQPNTAMTTFTVITDGIKDGLIRRLADK